MDETQARRLMELVGTLRRCTVELSSTYGRSFALDGHLLGSLGEVVAAYLFDLTLEPHSTKGYDAKAPDGRLIEVKVTQGRTVALRESPPHLVVLVMKADDFEVVFNGPGDAVWQRAGKPSKRNGQRPVSISVLRRLNASVAESSRIPQDRAWITSSQRQPPPPPRESLADALAIERTAWTARNAALGPNERPEPDPEGTRIRSLGIDE